MRRRAMLAVLLCLAGQAPAAPPLEVPDALPVQDSAAHGAAVVSGAGSGNGYVLLTSYDRSTWSGDLARHDIVDGRIASNPAWRAAASMPAAAERKIFTTVVRGDGATATVPFVPGALSDIDQDLVSYLRGDRSGEGKTRRARASALGDIVRSTPIVVGAPANIQGEGYASFRLRHAGRRQLAYVGANDGMLHAFDAATGVERLAYVPRALHAALPELAHPGYNHRAWVDASPGAGEAHTGDTWRTVLASGYGMGAKGVFAIDITRPDSFASGAGELWQFSDADDGKMGHVFSAPVIARIRVSRQDSEPRYRYFAVLASGLNNYTASGSPDGALFLLALDKPQRERWRINVNYFRLDAPAADRSDANALGPPSLVLAADGSVSYIYAGDLQGRLWRFDFRGAPPWRKAATALFSARDDSGRRQPISAAPRIVYAPGGGHLVLFGTGRLLEERDTLATQNGTQSLYAVHDNLAAEGAAIRSRGQLAARRLERDGDGFRISGQPIDYATDKGWYIDLPDSAQTGERMTTSPFVDGGVLVATSSLSGTGTRTYVLSALSGMAHIAAGPDAPGSATTGRISNSAAPVPPLLLLASSASGASDGTGRARAVRRYSFIPAMPGDAVPPPVSVEVPARRLSWREITNWQELHDAAPRPGGAQ